MAASLPDGSIVSIATAYDAVKNITGISNANPAIASAPAHGFPNGALIELRSGWNRLDSRIVRVASTAAGTFEIEGENTVSTKYFPTGSGAGTARLITQWTQISQILEFTTSGGDQQFATFSFLENDWETQLPTVTSAQSISIGIADDPSLAGFKALKAAKATRINTALKLDLPNGSVLVYNGIVSLNETPTLNKGSVMQVNASFSLQAPPSRY